MGKGRKKSFCSNGMYSFKDLVDIEQLRQTFEHFSRLTGFTTGLVSHPEQELLIGTGWRDICTKFHRACHASERHCRQSNIDLASKLERLEELNVRHCENGLVDGATPIIVQGMHLANLFTGQILFEKPDIHRFKKQAEEYGYEVEAYLEAVSRVPVVNKEKFQDAMLFLSDIAVMLADAGLRELRFRQMQNQRKQAEKKYRSLFESSMDALFLMSPESEILDCNPAALKLFGIDLKEELTGLSPADLSPEYQPDGTATKEKALLMVEKVFKDGSYFFEWIHKRDSGEEFEADVLLSKMEIDGGLAIHAAVRDISGHKKTQKMLIQSEKMISVGGLAAGMAHEINNPLASVMQNAGVLANRLMDKSLPRNIKAAKSLGLSMDKIHDYMDMRGIASMIKAINESGVRMAGIVENMLNFSRKNDSEFSSHNPPDLMEKTLAMASANYDLKKKFDFKSIIIEKKYDTGLPMIACNGNELQQVLLNIINNGAHAMFEKQSLEHDYKPRFILRISREPENKMLRMEIEDNGPGIDRKTCSRIFEPFFTTKPVGIGTGLGLSVSYFIITEHHRGTVEVESEVGRWTNFIIRLPL